MQDIELKLNLNEVNAVLSALGQMPYVQVAPLVEKVRTQAQRQVADQPTVVEAQ